MKNWRERDKQYVSESKKYPHPVPSREFIMQTIKEQGRALTFSALARMFGLNRGEKETLKHRLKAMLRDAQLEERANGKLRVAKPSHNLIGTVFAHPEGFGFFIPDDKTLTKGEDLFLHYSEMRNVMHGDKVEARIIKGNKKGKLEGKIIKVLEHAHKTIIGRLVDDYGIKVVKAENRRINQKILVTNLMHFDVELDQVVEVTIMDYPRGNKPILGEITRILGDKVDAGMEIEIAIAGYNLPHEWNEEVIQQTVTIPDELIASDYEGRVDLRKLPLVTIDGITAKDFDDAVFAKKTAKGYKLYVAIADVAHYVEKDSPLDIEAVNRATSVYFPNRVIPMLPEKLSNGLCSLNPHVDRLCMVCEMQISDEGEIIRSRFYEAVMNSHARLTYETVEEVLFGAEDLSNQRMAPMALKQLEQLMPHLQTLKSLYEVLRKQRDQRGALDFHTIEPEFEYDDEGKIARIVGRMGLKSHQLIEEFMVRANVCAAKFLLKQRGEDCPIAVFRNHQGPSEEKYDKLVQALAQEGIKLPKVEETVTPKQLSDVLEQLKSYDNFEALQILVLRSMHQAVYETENIGHFGLGLEHYAHFTSPIRRYPDLLVHRAIKHSINFPKELYVYSQTQMQALAEQCSMAERRADEAVYDVIGYLKCEFMNDKLGQTYRATISGVTNFGFFAVLDGQFIDGLVHISSLDGDYFNFDEERRILIGERSRLVYKVGDVVSIIVSKVNLDERRIDFILTEEYLPFGGNKSANQGKKKGKKKSEGRRKSPAKSRKRKK